MASPVVPCTVPLVSILRFPTPAFVAKIPLDEPVTALAVIVIVPPPAEVFTAFIPWSPTPVPSTVPSALILIVPVFELNA